MGMISLEHITFDDYIQNPTGTRNHIVGQKDIAKATYNTKFNQMLLKCAGNIGYMLWKERSPSHAEERYAIYIQMPSETVDLFKYDVFIDFRALDDVDKRIGKLDSYYVRFFSNDPNFIYTYAYAFKKSGLLVPECIPKISEKALKEAPLKTNPNNLAGYVKSIYFAYLFMKSRGLFNKLMWQNAANINELRMFVSNNLVGSDQKLMLLQQYTQLMKAKAKGDTTKVSSSDPNGIKNAASAATNKIKMMQSVIKVEKDIMSKHRNNSSSAVHKISTIKPIQKKGKLS